MRTHKMLPGYLLEANGTAINKETGEIEQLVSKNEYRLETAEKVFLETKGYSINLVRRFTKDQLVKLYKDADVSENPDKTKQVNEVNSLKSGLKQDFVTKVNEVNDNLPNDDKKVNDLEVNDPKKVNGIYVNGERFESLGQASKHTGINKSTINKRIQSDNFPTYYKIE